VQGDSSGPKFVVLLEPVAAAGAEGGSSKQQDAAAAAGVGQAVELARADNLDAAWKGVVALQDQCKGKKPSAPKGAAGKEAAAKDTAGPKDASKDAADKEASAAAPAAPSDGAPEAALAPPPYQIPDTATLPASVTAALAKGLSMKGLVGTVMFGFTDEHVLLLIEALPGVDDCKAYTFVEQRSLAGMAKVLQNQQERHEKALAANLEKAGKAKGQGEKKRAAEGGSGGGTDRKQASLLKFFSAGAAGGWWESCRRCEGLLGSCHDAAMIVCCLGLKGLRCGSLLDGLGEQLRPHAAALVPIASMQHAACMAVHWACMHGSSCDLPHTSHPHHLPHLLHHRPREARR
jgi:hypothetical protein